MNKTESNRQNYKRGFYAFLFILPILIIALLEITLRLVDYGNDYSTFVEMGEEAQEKLVFNPELPKKYFSDAKVVPSVIPDFFNKTKDENTYRIFVLGGSTTAGWPFPSTVSFPKFLKRKLDHNFPNQKFEVVNLGVSAINSYAVCDIIDDVLKEEPDLILIYMGHNEYYGALGAGSTVNSGRNKFTNKLVLSLKVYRLYQLLENIINYFRFSDNRKELSERKTLMSKMVGESEIHLNSEAYLDGVTQFETNLDEILSMCNEKKIDVILGNLVSNQKQNPFAQIQFGDSTDASKQFNLAIKSEEEGKFDEASKYYGDAIDYDFIRFRAPSDFNRIITQLAKKYSYPVTDIKSEFKSKSENEIIGYSLMSDHLHPNVVGYKLMSDKFYNQIINQHLLSKEEGSVGDQNYMLPFTELDSIYVYIKLQRLINDYPFSKTSADYTFSPKTEIEKLAKNIIDGNISWEKAHKSLADKYLKENKIELFIKEIYTLIEDKPYDEGGYKYLTAVMLNRNNLKPILPILLEYNKYFPNYLNNKLLGNIYLEDGAIDKSIRYFSNSIKFRNNDPEVYFKLSSAFFFQKKLDAAITTIESCLKLDPNYPNAKNIYNKLISIKQK